MGFVYNIIGLLKVVTKIRRTCPLSENHCRRTAKETCQRKLARPCTRANHLSQKTCHRKLARAHGALQNKWANKHQS